MPIFEITKSLLKSGQGKDLLRKESVEQKEMLRTTKHQRFGNVSKEHVGLVLATGTAALLLMSQLPPAS